MRGLLNCCKSAPKLAEPEPLQDPVETKALNEEKYTIERQVYNYTKFAKEHEPSPFGGVSLVSMLQALFLTQLYPSKSCAKKQLSSRVPAIKWIKNYSLKECFLADILAGLTIGIMHIPQGLAYALLATVPSIYGLYTSFFPVMVYWIFGTSRHLSIGAFAVVSLMVGHNLANLETKYVPPVEFNATAANMTHYLSLDRTQARVMIVASHAFWVGVVQFLMFFFQLGFVITSYFTEPFVNGFLASSSIHVATAQLKYLFGVHLTSYRGAFKIPMIYFEFLTKKLPEIRISSMIISIICITVLTVFKIHVNERFAKKLPVPIPIELVIVVFGTLISYFGKFSTVYHEDVVGPIQAGLPAPQFPAFFLIKDMISSSILTAIVAYTINYSLADVFSKKHRYKINSNQELFAYGATNVFASFFHCFTSGASMARTSLQGREMVGGRTQASCRTASENFG